MTAAGQTPLLLPGATLGVLGGGQLGRMFTLAARVMGYRVVVLDPDALSPAGQVADIHLKADYTDAVALMRMGELCDAVTTEFENVPARSLETLAHRCRVAPGAAAVSVAQDRLAEKDLARRAGCETALYAPVSGPDDMASAWAAIDGPGLLKTRRLGYDGKGQARVDGPDGLAAAHAQLGHVPCLLEGFLPLEREISVVLARNPAGEIAFFPVAENRHRQGILDVSIVPARVTDEVAGSARRMAAGLAGSLEYVGVLAVEFFVLADGRVVFNEMAPRPHNSGHYTQDACVTDQFQQQVRALCGLALGDARQLSPVVMVNLLGDVWRPEPRWDLLLAHPGIKLHLYGKAEARPGRKMGHFNCLAPSLEEAIALAETARLELEIDR
ncbi:MAG TPA: 5-(carboxyamino)imidazole ribonucleotide synthase [Thiobacillaceae bacterium]|nr:5-(carboxyamino)imidazole ribonucleotide synthase [Thiobacillaceae bacterium]